MVQGPEWVEDTERQKSAGAAIELCKELIEKNRIFLKEELCINIEKTLMDCHGVIIQMMQAKGLSKVHGNYIKYGTPDRIVDPLKPLNMWEEAGNKVSTEIRRQRKELTQEFRNILGA